MKSIVFTLLLCITQTQASMPPYYYYDKIYKLHLNVEVKDKWGQNQINFNLNNELIGVFSLDSPERVSALTDNSDNVNKKRKSIREEYQRIFDPDNEKSIFFALLNKIKEKYSNFKKSETIIQGVNLENKVLKKQTFEFTVTIPPNAPHQIFIAINNMLSKVPHIKANLTPPDSSIWKQTPQ